MAEDFSSGYINTAFKTAEDLGVTRSDILAFLGIDGTQLVNRLRRYSLDEAAGLLQFCIRNTRVPYFGLLVGKGCQPASFDLTGLATSCCATLREAMQLNFQYQGIGQRLVVQESMVPEQGGKIRFKIACDIREPNEQLIPVIESILLGYMSLWRSLTWASNDLFKSICLPFRKPRHGECYPQLFGCKVAFNSYEPVIYLNECYLDIPSPHNDPLILSVLEKRLQQRFDELGLHNVMTSRVTSYLQTQPNLLNINIHSVARRLGCSERTLRRRLEEENTSFSEILEAYKKSLSVSYLRRLSLPLTDIAQLLGYNDQCAFHRAFKRWYNTTPREYRMKTGV
ncbi:MAG: AraC family transcriptional regulator ligand-binding domain-containing protein [Ketobacteraceae bacterium]|nr:AraC family transcriptional regulator ligand-binding domain-containing protein [Ketobacteraceae bacterium]